MPAPTTATFSDDSIVAAHTALRDLVDSGSGAGKIRVRNSSDVLLAEVPLEDPSGSVNGTTGQLTFAIDGPDPDAEATGTIAYVEITDSDNNVYLSIPAVQGTVAVSGKAVFNTLSVTEGYPVTVIAATLG